MENKGKSVQEEMAMLQRKIEEKQEETKSILAKFQVEEERATVGEEIIELSQAEKEEIDSRSVYIGNVDYQCTADEVQEHFEACGIVNRVTILTNEFGSPKGYAFVEFTETKSVQNALDLNGSELRDRQIKVSRKRTNIPGMSQNQRRFPRGPFMPGQPFNPSYGYGRFPRYKPNNRYGPY